MLKKVVNGPGIAWVDLQPEFTKSLLQTIGGGVGRLIDADMNEASTKSEAIQARSRYPFGACRSPTQAPRTFPVCSNNAP
ncbi:MULTISPECIES: hypothetical protein [unclassified Ensifer]|uniref:hypothetical protein n=1 Tax=unclassified Ensifer TaxID=2633371 RepID=UPI000A7EDBA8|nr:MULTISPECIES: hypothetical protein [unclassified Ensifer]